MISACIHVQTLACHTSTLQGTAIPLLHAFYLCLLVQSARLPAGSVWYLSLVGSQLRSAPWIAPAKAMLMKQSLPRSPRASITRALSHHIPFQMMYGCRPLNPKREKTADVLCLCVPCSSQFRFFF